MDLLAIQGKADAILDAHGGQFILRSETPGSLDPVLQTLGPPNITEYKVAGALQSKGYELVDGKLTPRGDARFVFSARDLPANVNLENPVFEVYVKATGRRIGRMLNVRPTQPDGVTTVAYRCDLAH